MEAARNVAGRGKYMTSSMMTVQEVANVLGVSAQRVRFLIRRKRLPARRYGISWRVNIRDVLNLAIGGPGRPKNTG